MNELNSSEVQANAELTTLMVVLQALIRDLRRRDDAAADRVEAEVRQQVATSAAVMKGNPVEPYFRAVNEVLDGIFIPSRA